LVLKDSYLVVLKPQKLVNEEVNDIRSRTRHQAGSQETVSTLADVENDQMTHRPQRRWHRGRRWRYCKVVLIDQFFKYCTQASSIGPVFHVRNMHGHTQPHLGSNPRPVGQKSNAPTIEAPARCLAGLDRE
uniref:PHM7_ext domain-containing protein n=1 Tax=Schistocephalus solidus TaxID=70667 RepID=A0A183TMI6_SCHSO